MRFSYYDTDLIAKITEAGRERLREMVKVLDEPKDPKHVKKVSCNHCASKLEYTKNEVKEYHGRDYSGGPDGRKWIDCPVCNKEIVLESW